MRAYLLFFAVLALFAVLVLAPWLGLASDVTRTLTEVIS